MARVPFGTVEGASRSIWALVLCSIARHFVAPSPDLTQFAAAGALIRMTRET